jgi:FtsZ-interacting cell division protein YlmF
MVGLSDMEDEVRRRVDQPSEQRDLHDAPLEQERRGHQQYRKSEVQRAVVPDQVLVIRAQSRDLVTAGQREVIVEGAGQDQSPEAA